MLRKRNVRLGFGLILLTIFATTLYGLFRGVGVGDITEGATPLFAFPSSKRYADETPVVFWTKNGEEAILFYYNYSGAKPPVRVQIATGKNLPLFSAAENVIAAGIRCDNSDIKLSRDGSRLLWTERVGGKSRGNRQCVLDLAGSSSSAKTVRRWTQAGTYNRKTFWLADGRRWVGSPDLSAPAGRSWFLYNADDTADVRLIPTAPTRGTGSEDVVVGIAAEEKLVVYDLDTCKLSYHDLNRIGEVAATTVRPARPDFSRVGRQGLGPVSVSPDGTQILWRSQIRTKFVHMAYDPRWAWLNRIAWVRKLLLAEYYKQRFTFYVSDVRGNDLRAVFTVGYDFRTALGWSHDGRNITFGRNGTMFIRPLSR